jgi:quercetin dioxygenase-like cupin family protein
MAEPRVPFDPQRFDWAGVERREYKPIPGAGGARGMGFSGVTRQTLARPDDLTAGYELRYFEFEPEGYSSLEKHRHSHFVVVLRGEGRALVDHEVVDCRPFDAVHVPPLTPHRWLNVGAGPFGFLCTVDGARDRPQPLDDGEWEALKADPATAPYVF